MSSVSLGGDKGRCWSQTFESMKLLKPNRNVQSDSIRAKVFLYFLLFIISAPSYVNFRAKIAFNAVICMILFIFP